MRQPTIVSESACRFLDERGEPASVVNDLKNDTYFARLILNVENEFQHKIVEIDARPSDCIALAAHQGAPIFVKPRKTA